MIFDYWLIWMSCPNETITWGLMVDKEGLCYYDGYNATFWYFLNVEWYRMNNKLFASTDSKEPFDQNLRDFDKNYLFENNYLK